MLFLSKDPCYWVSNKVPVMINDLMNLIGLVCFQFATEAAITILRIDDMIRLAKDESQNDE